VPIERRELAPGLSISRVVTGLWQIADLERDGKLVDPELTAAAMRPYVDAGFTTFDMADHYGSAEVVAGSFRERFAPDGGVELLTKWVPAPGAVTRNDVRMAVQRSLDRLRTAHIDVMQFHAWTFTDPSWLDALFWLQELKAEGLIRHLGVTNFDTAHLRVAVESGVELASNQVCCSLLDRRAQGRMSEYCQSRGIGILAYGTVAGGFLSERWLGRAEPDWIDGRTWSEMKYGRFIVAAGGWTPFQRLLLAAKAVATRHGVSIANVACRYVLEQPAVAGIIVGARLGMSEHVRDNARLFGFALTDEDRRELASATDGLQPIPGDSGDEYRRPPFLTASGDLSHHVSDFPAPFAVRHEPNGRRLCLSGTSWETRFGYSRAVRQGNRILVSGTTASHGDQLIGGADPAAQTHFVIDKIAGAIQSLGGTLQDVVRTRILVSRMAHWEAVARAHGERFAEILPANTLVQASLVGDEYLVEMEAEAVVSSGPAQLE
jgi:aryl-alcohol dehydrogenase-like predicted oxidoreductase/enamine deaminase RidA (YjgF/YER057c/UK114 family)